VRCLLFNGDAILVERDLDGVHILPGGRCEKDETLEHTLRREILEETGWTIDTPRILGCLHFHHLSPRPARYPFAYPDFLQPIFMAEAVDDLPDQRVHDDYVVDSAFRAMSEVLQLPLPAGQQHLLATALRLRRERMPGGCPRFKSGLRVREGAPLAATEW
jgi:8-oxo-dGTP pyrophosphatase MutT (NUDIX family)